MEFVLSLAAGSALALPCGLSPFLPLLVLAVAGLGRKTDIYSPFDLLATGPGIAVIALLVGYDIFADKMQGLQGRNNLVGYITRPLGGGIAAAAVIPPTLVFPGISFLLGAGLALAMHLVKIKLRPALAASGSLASVLEPLVSMGEDLLSVVLAVLALAIPLFAAPLGLLVMAGGWGWQLSLRRKKRQVV